MAKLDKFEDLKCWQSARVLVNMIYRQCKKGELKNDWDTKSQLKRATLSIMNNIAEGFGRINEKDALKFYDYAQSSGFEVRSMLYVLIDLEYITENEFETLMNETNKTINLTLGFIRYLRNRK